LLRLLSALRFDTARDLKHVQETISLQMMLAGLRGDTPAIRIGADWVAEQVGNGERLLTLEAIDAAIDRLELRAGPPRAIVSIATLKRDPLSEQATYAIDWVDRFDGKDAFTKRRPQPPATWNQLLTDIEMIPGELGDATQVAITGSLRQATAFAVGAALRMVTNVDLAVVQRDQLWATSAEYGQPTEPTTEEHILSLGGGIAIAIEVAAPLAEDVIEFLKRDRIAVDRLVVLRPPGGTKDNSIADAADANSLAVGIRNAARRASQGLGDVHLFLAGPMGLALLLGHRWNRVAPTIVYEDLGGKLSYEAAFMISA
jgi:hypothetical protein